VTGVQTCALPIYTTSGANARAKGEATLPAPTPPADG